MVTDRLGHDRRYALDDSKIRDALGYRPLVEFESGLADTLAWYRENESWWRPLKAGEPVQRSAP
jgi:dTDP-glucose 4,6-dehydratase